MIPFTNNLIGVQSDVKAVITIFMLVLTFINPVLFIIPTALCGYALSKSNPV